MRLGSWGVLSSDVLYILAATSLEASVLEYSGYDRDTGELRIKLYAEGRIDDPGEGFVRDLKNVPKEDVLLTPERQRQIESLRKQEAEKYEREVREREEKETLTRKSSPINTAAGRPNQLEFKIDEEIVLRRRDLVEKIESDKRNIAPTESVKNVVEISAIIKNKLKDIPVSFSTMEDGVKRIRQAPIPKDFWEKLISPKQLSDVARSVYNELTKSTGLKDEHWTRLEYKIEKGSFGEAKFKGRMRGQARAYKLSDPSDSSIGEVIFNVDKDSLWSMNCAEKLRDLGISWPASKCSNSVDLTIYFLNLLNERKFVNPTTGSPVKNLNEINDRLVGVMNKGQRDLLNEFHGVANSYKNMKLTLDKLINLLPTFKALKLPGGSPITMGGTAFWTDYFKGPNITQASSIVNEINAILNRQTNDITTFALKIKKDDISKPAKEIEMVGEGAGGEDVYVETKQSPSRDVINLRDLLYGSDAKNLNLDEGMFTTAHNLPNVEDAKSYSSKIMNRLSDDAFLSLFDPKNPVRKKFQSKPGFLTALIESKKARGLV